MSLHHKPFSSVRLKRQMVNMKHLDQTDDGFNAPEGMGYRMFANGIEVKVKQPTDIYQENNLKPQTMQ